MSVLSLDLEPNVSNEEFPAPPHSGQTELDDRQIDDFAKNFKVFEPAYVPAGFVESSIRYSTIQGAPVIVRTYTDGVQEIFIAQHPELQTPELPPGFPENTPLRVSVTMHGALSYALFGLDGTEIQVLSKINHAELMNFIEALQ
jgi:hypothetical protein